MGIPITPIGQILEDMDISYHSTSEEKHTSPIALSRRLAIRFIEGTQNVVIWVHFVNVKVLHRGSDCILVVRVLV